MQHVAPFAPVSKGINTIQGNSALLCTFFLEEPAAYDLLNTRLHLPNESVMALDLFELDFETESFKANGFYACDDFAAFGSKIGIPAIRVERFINELLGQKERVIDLLSRSFLDDQLKTRYAAMVEERAKAIGYSFGKSVN